MSTNEKPPVATVASIAFYYRLTNERILKIVEDLSDEQWIRKTETTNRSVALIVWHLARWADLLQANLPDMTPELGEKLGSSRQIWETESLAVKWGFEAAGLGYSETGWLMDDAQAAKLPLPAKDVLLDYVRRAFSAAERAVDALDNNSLFQALSSSNNPTTQ
jgi:hypothetical protein